MSDPVKERAKRLKEAVRAAGGNVVVASRASIPLRSLGNYLNGRDMKASAIIDLADACGVSLDWLATGKGDGPVALGSVAQQSRPTQAGSSNTEIAKCADRDRRLWIREIVRCSYDNAVDATVSPGAAIRFSPADELRHLHAHVQAVGAFAGYLNSVIVGHLDHSVAVAAIEFAAQSVVDICEQLSDLQPADTEAPQ